MNRVQTAIYQQPKKGNYICGDSYFYEETDGGFICAIADGLGSGEMAKESSQTAINVIRGNPTAAPEIILKDINTALAGKRGVVIGVLRFDYATDTFTFLSVGNIGLVAINSAHKKVRHISNAGYLAGYQRAFKLEEKNLEAEMNFLLFSDGVSERELSKDYMKTENVKDLITLYSHLSSNEKQDDTTLMAIRYEKND